MEQTKRKKVVGVCTTKLSGLGNMTANKIIRLLSQKQFGNILGDTFEVQSKQANIICEMIALFETANPKKIGWIIEDLKKAANEYRDVKVKRYIDLFGEEDYHKLFV